MRRHYGGKKKESCRKEEVKVRTCEGRPFSVHGNRTVKKGKKGGRRRKGERTKSMGLGHLPISGGWPGNRGGKRKRPWGKKGRKERRGEDRKTAHILFRFPSPVINERKERKGKRKNGEGKGK